MTPAELDAIEARAKAATPGPWVPVDDFCADGYAYRSEPHPEDCPCRGYSIGETHQSDTRLPIYAPLGDYLKRDHRTFDNAEFIAHARHDIPALIAEVRRLRELVQVGPRLSGPGSP